jgi:hypothetical protein
MRLSKAKQCTSLRRASMHGAEEGGIWCGLIASASAIDVVE